MPLHFFTTSPNKALEVVNLEFQDLALLSFNICTCLKTKTKKKKTKIKPHK